MSGVCYIEYDIGIGGMAGDLNGHCIIGADVCPIGNRFALLNRQVKQSKEGKNRSPVGIPWGPCEGKCRRREEGFHRRAKLSNGVCHTGDLEREGKTGEMNLRLDCEDRIGGREVRLDNSRRKRDV